MFSIIGKLVADSIASLSLLTPIETAAVSAILAVTLGGLGVLAWLTNEREAATARTFEPQPRFDKAA